MRELINKISLVESQQFDKLLISSHIKKSHFYDYELMVSFIVSHEPDDESDYVDIKCEISFNYDLDSAGNLIPLEDGEVVFYPVYTPKQHSYTVSEIEKDAKYIILPDLKLELAKIGFSKEAISKVTISLNDINDLELRNCDMIHHEVNESYQWRQESIGDLS